MPITDADILSAVLYGV